MKKNEMIVLEITDITSEGNGVGRYEGIAVFVPETAIGDIIEAKIVKVLKNYCYGIVKQIITPSPDRITPDCDHFPKCGGCSLRHISYEAECRHKEKIVYDAFTRIGKIRAEFMPILSCPAPDNYRNKAQYPVGMTDDGAVCGFYAKRSHRIISGTQCRLLPPIFPKIADTVMKYLSSRNIQGYNEQTHRGTVRHIFLRQGYHTGEIMVCLVVTEDKRELFSELFSLLNQNYPEIKSIVMNINPDNTNVILGKKTITLSGNSLITDTMCENSIDIAPQAFYQINTPQAESLYRQAEEFADLTSNDTLLDLYCGAGTIGLSMAKKIKKLIGVEIIPQAVENAIKNAASNGIKNAEFICSDAGAAAEKLAAMGICPDVITIDPPRKGCDDLTLDSTVKMSPKRVVMISCNPSTAARDCAYLEALGYKVKKIRAVDMFPRTDHVECVVLLSREKS